MQDIDNNNRSTDAEDNNNRSTAGNRPNNQIKEICVRAYDWIVKDASTEDGKLSIHCWSINKESEPGLIRFDGFPASCYLELPNSIGPLKVNWNGPLLAKVTKFLETALKDHKPERMLFKKTRRIYYFTLNDDRQALLVTFPTIQAMEHCKNLLKEPVNIPNLGIIQIRVWEDTISCVRKLLTLRNLKYTQWFTANVIEAPANRRISTLEHEYIGDWRTIQPVAQIKTVSWRTRPGVLSIDIETHSQRIISFPDALRASDVITYISLVYQRVGDKSSRKNYLISRIGIGEIKNVGVEKMSAQVIMAESDEEMIQKMAEIVNMLNPELIIGYNILGFDYKYMNIRLERMMKDWPFMSMLRGVPTKAKPKTWRSDAYGIQTFTELRMDGRITVDIMTVIQRDYKLRNYDLDTVGKKFVGRGKHPIDMEQMFREYEKYLALSQHPDKDNLQTDIGKEYARVLEELRNFGVYCIFDSWIVMDIFEKLNLWDYFLVTSEVVGIDIASLFTGGQQKKCMSLIYDKAARKNIMVTQYQMVHEQCNGALVHNPKLGFHKNIITLDFASLYPSIIQATNACYTTFVPPELDDVIPDEHCNIEEFEQDELLEEDDEDEDAIDTTSDIAKVARKTKKGEAIKRKHRYRYYKGPDGKFKGILPEICEELVSERKKVREEIKKYEEGSFEYMVLDKRQLALKISVNSVYGFTGVENGKLPFTKITMTVTAVGRRMITTVQNGVKKDHGGVIIYGDTDSVMIDMHIEDPKECNKVGNMLAEYISGAPEKKLPDGTIIPAKKGLFPPPLKMEFERSMDMLLLKKKMYFFMPINKDGVKETKKERMQKKGVPSARRDKIGLVQNIVDDIAYMRMTGKMAIEVFDYLIDEIDKLVTGKIPVERLTYVKQLGDNYSNPNFYINVLAQRLRSENKDVNPGDRLSYVIIEDPRAKNVGPRMRTPEEFEAAKGTPREMKLDYSSYMTSMEKPIENVLNVCFPDFIGCRWHIGYKPKGRAHFTPIPRIIRMMIKMNKDGVDLKLIKNMIRQPLPPPAVFEIVDDTQPQTQPYLNQPYPGQPYLNQPYLAPTFYDQIISSNGLGLNPSLNNTGSSNILFSNPLPQNNLVIPSSLGSSQGLLNSSDTPDSRGLARSKSIVVE